MLKIGVGPSYTLYLLIIRDLSDRDSDCDRETKPTALHMQEKFKSVLVTAGQKERQESTQNTTVTNSTAYASYKIKATT